jgi:hypothetical protein
MVEALVSPSNGFDPARLDPKAVLPRVGRCNPPMPNCSKRWPTTFIANKYDLRKLIATIVKSSNLSTFSAYPGTWTLALVPYYARKFARRLDAEEVHDAILKATGIGVTYQLRRSVGQQHLRRELGDAIARSDEPATNGQRRYNSQLFHSRRPRRQAAFAGAVHPTGAQFDEQPVCHDARASAGYQALPSGRCWLIANLTPTQLVTQLYLNTLSRNPSQGELDKLTPLFSSLGRQPAAEAVQWSLINKMDFCFNY